MIYLNFTDLNEETQDFLLYTSKKEIEERHGNEMKRYAKRNGLDYDALLEQEAQRNLYSYEYVFSI